jgi:hypothetical protein
MGDATVAFEQGVTIEAGRDPRTVSWELLGGGTLEGLGYRCSPGVDPW